MAIGGLDSAGAYSPAIVRDNCWSVYDTRRVSDNNNGVTVIIILIIEMKSTNKYLQCHFVHALLLIMQLSELVCDIFVTFICMYIFIWKGFYCEYEYNFPRREYPEGTRARARALPSIIQPAY